MHSVLRSFNSGLTGQNAWKLVSFLLGSPIVSFLVAEVSYRHFIATVIPNSSPRALQTDTDSNIGTPSFLLHLRIQFSDYLLARNPNKLKQLCQNPGIVSPAVFWVAVVAALELRHMIKLS